MKKMFLVLIPLLSVFSLFNAFARDAVFEGDNYTIALKYNEKACPGDAIFAKITFSQTSKQSKKLKIKLEDTEVTLKLLTGDKELDKTTFYSIPEESSRTSQTFLAGIPLSSWWNPDNKYDVKILYKFSNGSAFGFTVPFDMEFKKFVEETIPLDDKNTATKTDTSPKRMAQIEKLNAILATSNASHIFQMTPFAAPTTATRRTSFFADRRIYAYSNGKSSTSLHYGTDYGVPEGSEVTSCAAGRVVLAEDRVTTGYSVVIEHLPGLYSLYYHMSELKVKEGDTVKKGQLIGLSGSTGLATGPHLHWEMRLNSSAVNPDFFTTDFAFSGK